MYRSLIIWNILKKENILQIKKYYMYIYDRKTMSSNQLHASLISWELLYSSIVTTSSAWKKNERQMYWYTYFMFRLIFVYSKVSTLPLLISSFLKNSSKSTIPVISININNSVSLMRWSSSRSKEWKSQTFKLTICVKKKKWQYFGNVFDF